MSFMHHDGICVSSSVEAEGTKRLLISVHVCYVTCYLRLIFIVSTFSVVACHVGDWVEVQCDYSPGICSEGGTGVVVATVGGTHSPIPLTISYH